jgi:hypothetical protein
MSTSVKAWMNVNSTQPDFGFDEAELVTFNSMVRDLPTFDTRTMQDLEACAKSHVLPRERERAMWELAYRNVPATDRLLTQFFQNETDSSVKANLIWLALKIAPSEAMKLIQRGLSDEDREVRDWARLYLSEITGSAFQSEYQTGIYVRNRVFDQTLPLQIAGFAVVSVGALDRRIVLSPLWFAHIQGRVMACTRDDTFMTDLTIEKCYFNYHPDGSDHYEIYPFSGKSWKTDEMTFQHRYLGRAIRPTYLSGKVEEDPGNQIRVPIVVNRAATTTGRYIQAFEHEDRAPASTSLISSLVTERRVVSHVKGQYFGWAHASLKHFAQHGDVLPGTVQLVSPAERETASLINCYICGTFRGKLSDHNRDGSLDINEVVCHGTPDGRLDYAGDGKFAPDPFE